MFACKNCGGNVIYDIASGQLACTYCHTLFDPYAYEEKTTDAEIQKDFEATIFTCPQCGGEILSTDDTAAGFCSFCGASTVLYSRIEKEHRPAYIIPFTKTKEDCKKAYGKLMKKSIFAPKELKDPKYIDGAFICHTGPTMWSRRHRFPLMRRNHTEEVTTSSRFTVN